MRIHACFVYILLALGGLATLGFSGLNPFNQMTAKVMLMLRLPVRTEQPQFDTELKASVIEKPLRMQQGSGLRRLVINIGMPKTGTSSLTSFLNQQGYECAHWRANRTHVGIEVRRHLFSNALKDFNCFTQLDYCEWVSKAENISRSIWPQHEMLTEFVSRYPKAKYVYTTRNTSTWFDSVSRWGDILDRIRFSSTPGINMARLMIRSRSGMR